MIVLIDSALSFEQVTAVYTCVLALVRAVGMR